MSSHFAHVDASKCNAESLIHWCYKNNFIVEGGKFNIVDRKSGTVTCHTCKAIAVEKQVVVDSIHYRPDVTVETTDGETIFFEMNYKNRKKPEDYINTWLAFNHTVVEVDIKFLLQLRYYDNDFVFYPIFSDGKCYGRITKNKKITESIINMKESAYRKRSDIAKEFVNRLDWFWKDLANYKNSNGDIDCLYLSLDYLIENSDIKDRKTIFEIINKFKCSDAIEQYNIYKSKLITTRIKDIFSSPIVSRWYTFKFMYRRAIGANVSFPCILISGKDCCVSNMFCFDEYSVDGIVHAIEHFISTHCKDVIFECLMSRSSYVFQQYFNDKTIHLSVFYKSVCTVKNLDRYDFVKATNKLQELKFKAQEHVRERNRLIAETDCTKTIKIKKKIEYSSEQINIEIHKVLYPLIYIVNKSNLKDVHIRLNPNFTKNEYGKTMCWIISDFIEALECIDVKNIVNERLED